MQPIFEASQSQNPFQREAQFVSIGSWPKSLDAMPKDSLSTALFSNKVCALFLCCTGAKATLDGLAPREVAWAKGDGVDTIQGTMFTIILLPMFSCCGEIIKIQMRRNSFSLSSKMIVSPGLGFFARHGCWAAGLFLELSNFSS